LATSQDTFARAVKMLQHMSLAAIRIKEKMALPSAKSMNLMPDEIQEKKMLCTDLDSKGIIILW